MKKLSTLLLFITILKIGYSQNGLEGLIVEKYYLSNANDTSVNDVGGDLPVGSMTYRFYLDLLPGYKFQAAYGLPGHELRIETSTLFFNNEDRGDVYPAYTKANAKDNTVMLDSWLSTGAACVGNFGVLKSEDTDNSATVVNAESPQVLQNNDPICGTPINVKDGLQTGSPGVFGSIGIDNEIAVFGSQNDGTNGPVFSTTNGSWYCLGGSVGADSSINKVLIAQITTNGNLKYKLNIQIGTPSGGVQNYVAENLPGDTTSIVSSFLNDSIAAPNSLNEIQSSNNHNLTVFPNPAGAEILTIKNANHKFSNSSYIEVFDGKGLLIESTPVVLNTPNSFTHNFSNYTSGIYLIKVTDSSHSFIQKIIIKK
jgi:hypothetical protein